MIPDRESRSTPSSPASSPLAPNCPARFAAPAIATALLTLMVAAPAAAVDLRNEDDRSYEVRIEDGAVTIHTGISGNSTRIDLTRAATVIVVGAGSFRAEGLREVRIRDGLLHFD